MRAVVAPASRGKPQTLGCEDVDLEAERSAFFQEVLPVEIATVPLWRDVFHLGHRKLNDGSLSWLLLGQVVCNQRSRLRRSFLPQKLWRKAPELRHVLRR